MGKKDKVKIGDTVICIDDRAMDGSESAPKVVYKKKYIVLDTSKCSCCGAIAYDIGLRSVSLLSTACKSKKFPFGRICKGTYPGKQIHWCGDFRFEKSTPQENEESKEESIEIKCTTKKLSQLEISQN